MQALFAVLMWFVASASGQQKTWENAREARIGMEAIVRSREWLFCFVPSRRCCFLLLGLTCPAPRPMFGGPETKWGADAKKIQAKFDVSDLPPPAASLQCLLTRHLIRLSH